MPLPLAECLSRLDEFSKTAEIPQEPSKNLRLINNINNNQSKNLRRVQLGRLVRTDKTLQTAVNLWPERSRDKAVGTLICLIEEKGLNVVREAIDITCQVPGVLNFEAYLKSVLKNG